MSLTPPVSYPGVYVQEIVSSVKTIVGVPTSITAFIGRALRGPSDSDPDSPVLIHSFADYERIFGGLWKNSEMSYAVYQYFLSGGVDAVIVRVYKPLPPSGTPTQRNKATFTYVDRTWLLKLQAANEGEWGKYLTIVLDTDVDQTVQAIDPTIFNLTVTDTNPLPAGGTTETHRNLSLDPQSAQFITKVLQYESQLVKVVPPTPPSTIPNSLPSRTYPDQMLQLGLPFTCDQTGDPPSPTADSKTIQTNVNTPVKITLTGTDFIPGDTLTFTADTGSKNGTITPLTPQTPNTVTYTPNPGYTGPDSFTYQATDGLGNTASATVTVNVLSQSDPGPPTANSQTVQANTDGNVPITLRSTDFVPEDKDTDLSYITTEDAGFGKVKSPAPAVSYTPNSSFLNGFDYFTYKATDSKGVDSNIARVCIIVNPTGSTLPTADSKNIEFTAPSATITLTGTGDALKFSVVDEPTKGNLTLEPTTAATYTYTPNSSFLNGFDYFTYKATDSKGVDSNIARVCIIVNPTGSTLPTADSKNIQFTAPSAITLTGTGDTPKFSVVDEPKNGNLTACPYTVTYTPKIGYFGTDSFRYKASDGRRIVSLDATVNIIVTQKPSAAGAPNADNITKQTNPGTKVPITLTGSPSTGLTFTYEQPTFGTVTGTAPAVTYTPKPGYVGTDSFVYKVTDTTKSPQVVSNYATVTITVDVDLDGMTITDNEIQGDQAKKTGYWALENADLFNLLCIPPYDSTSGSETGPSGFVLTEASTYCGIKRAMLLVDAPFTSVWPSASAPLDANIGIDSSNFGGYGSRLDRTANAAIFFPRVYMPDLLNNNRTREFAPCGVVAGVIAQTDGTRGVWKAPAGIEASLTGVSDVTISLTNNENGTLNPRGINCLRVMPAAGPVIWGSRTLRGDDKLTDQWKYLAVRRTALYIEESLYRGIQWVVFEPNDEPLWSQIRLNVGAFMQSLFIQGAFQGQTPKDAYFVKCDSDTTTQTDIDNGIVNIIVGFAPLKPAEFVILKIEQMAGQGA